MTKGQVKSPRARHSTSDEQLFKRNLLRVLVKARIIAHPHGELPPDLAEDATEILQQIYNDDVWPWDEEYLRALDRTSSKSTASVAEAIREEQVRMPWE